MAGLPSRAVVQVSGRIRPPLASTHASPHSAAIRPVAVPVCGLLQCRYGKSLLQGDFRSVVSWPLFVSRPGSLLDLAIADAVPPASAERFRPTAAGSFARRVGHPSCMSRLLTTSRAIVPLSGWIRSPFPAARAVRPAAHKHAHAHAHTLCIHCRCGQSLLQGYFGSVQSMDLLVSRQGSLLDLAVADAVPPASANRFRPIAAGSFARRVGHPSSLSRLLTTSRAIVPLSGWIRSPFPVPGAIRPAASSFGPVAAPVGFCIRCRCGESLLQGYFGSVQSWHLSFSRQAGTHSLLDFAIADSVPYSCAARFAFAAPAPGYSAKHVRDACMAGLTKGRAIVQVSGWIRPPFASVHTIPSSLAHDERKQRRLAGFIGVFVGVYQNVLAPGLAHKSSSERAKHSVSCMRFQELAISRALRPVHTRKKDQGLRSFGSAAPPSMMGPLSCSPSRPSPSAACVLRLQGAVRSVFRPDIEEAVEANCLVISPLEETLRQAQVPFMLMIRNLLPLPTSRALQGREVLLNLVLVGHSHGGVIGHSLAQCLESAGFLVKGIVAVDTLGLPRWTEMPLRHFDPQALARHLSPHHWQLTAPKLNMMAPEVPWLFWCCK